MQSPSSRSGNTLYKVIGYDLVSHRKFEISIKGDEIVEPVEVTRHEIKLHYRDTKSCTFMDNESYEQYTLPDTDLEDELAFLVDDLEGLKARISEGNIPGIELPSTVILEIRKCAPGIKAASSLARARPATLNSGLIVQIPEYLSTG